MAASTRQAKVLRIGIIQDGKIVQERLVKAGESVTVGESAKNTFVFPKTKLDESEFLLFEWRDTHYALRFNEKMRGKVSTGGTVLGLDKVRKDPAIQQTGGAWMLPLSDQDKGKVSIAPVTVLFQFVAPPPVQAVKPLEAMDFRPRLIEDDDPVLLGSLAIMSAIAVLFVALVANTELPEPTLEEIPDRFVQIIQPPEAPPPAEEQPKDEEKPEEKQPDAEAPKQKVAKKKVVERPKDPPKKRADESEQQRAERIEQQKKEVVEQSALFTRLLATTGENGKGVVSIDAADGGNNAEDLAAKLEAAASSDVAVAAAGGIRKGSGKGASGDRDIGGVGKGGGDGVVDAGPGPAVAAPAGKVSYSEPEFDGGDSGGVNKVVRRYRGQLKHCYDQALKAKPNLAGRVVIGWSVIGEAARDVYIAQNTTGDEAFARCMVGKVKRWKFSGVDDGDARVPFVFEPE